MIGLEIGRYLEFEAANAGQKGETIDPSHNVSGLSKFPGWLHGLSFVYVGLTQGHWGPVLVA